MLIETIGAAGHEDEREQTAPGELLFLLEMPNEIIAKVINIRDVLLLWYCAYSEQVMEFLTPMDILNLARYSTLRDMLMSKDS